ncbi:MAG: ABC transporter permease [Candidatus Riesia sp.]|nr:ABC transporter permease [Candidatus Riesia sp.]
MIKCNIISFNTIKNKEITRILRIWPQTILPPIVTVILYFFIFGNLIGNKLGNMTGYSYMQYIIPGLTMMAVITNSYSNVVSSFFASKFQKSIEEILISPTYNSTIILGFITGGIFRSLIIFIFIMITAQFFSNFYIYNNTIFILSYLLTSVIFSLIGFINGLFAKKFDDISIIPTFILTPMIYLGGIFYSIELLPENFIPFMKMNPIFYIVNLFRYSILGISEINIIYAIFFMLILIVILYYLSLNILSKGYEIKK